MLANMLAFPKIFSRKKMFALFLKLSRIKNARTFKFFCRKGEKYQFFWKYFEKILAWFYSQLNILLAGDFTHFFPFSENFSLFPRKFLLFSRIALSRTFFFLAFFSSHASKKRICEEKKNLWSCGHVGGYIDGAKRHFFFF